MALPMMALLMMALPMSVDDGSTHDGFECLWLLYAWTFWETDGEMEGGRKWLRT